MHSEPFRCDARRPAVAQPGWRKALHARSRPWCARALALCCAWAIATLVQAQNWPQKPVRVISPYAAGGHSDNMARIASERLSQALGQPFIVENRVGAGGAVAAEFVARAAPDGYTLFFCAVPQISIIPHFQKVSYDPLKDFAPISAFGTSAMIVGVHPSVPAKTLQQFVAYAKARPGKINFASGGTGTFSHLAASLLMSKAGLDMVHVPYKGGALATNDLIGGQVQLYFGNVSELIPQGRAGKATLLGISSPQRSPEIPDVPTVAESYPGFQLVAWNGYLAPAGTPRDVIDRVAQEAAKAARDPAVVERLAKSGTQALGNSPAEFAAMIKEEQALYRDAVQAAGLKADR